MDRIEWFLFLNSFKVFASNFLAFAEMQNMNIFKDVAGQGVVLEEWSVLELRVSWW